MPMLRTKGDDCQWRDAVTAPWLRSMIFIKMWCFHYKEYWSKDCSLRNIPQETMVNEDVLQSLRIAICLRPHYIKSQIRCAIEAVREVYGKYCSRADILNNDRIGWSPECMRSRWKIRICMRYWRPLRRLFYLRWPTINLFLTLTMCLVTNSAIRNKKIVGQTTTISWNCTCPLNEQHE